MYEIHNDLHNIEILFHIKSQKGHKLYYIFSEYGKKAA